MRAPSPRHPEHLRWYVVTPEAGFAAAAFVGFVIWGWLVATALAHVVMPAIATAFLVFAAAFGIIGWRYGQSDLNRVTYSDVAGALTLIGLFAAANIEPSDMAEVVSGCRAFLTRC